ncbi:MAG: ABC transporter ATP-binding protein [Bifidobacteriaceae bacterium]|jgi:peptide/nickel transport system ATP-binding protein|nr:ABC transporter ATP-binding protein [Bifidobacteriaceae bacterium]
MTLLASDAPAEAAPATTQPLVAVRDLEVTFPGQPPVEAVRGLSFDIFPGRVTALVGESGSGKSVTARTLVGLAGDHARVGATRFQVAGANALTLSERRWRRLRGGRIGFVFQDALTSLDPLRTVAREVSEPLRVHGSTPRRERLDRVYQLLADVGVPDPEIRAHQYAHQLSGGLRQRALIASALAANPELLIVDEPTTALDVTVQAQILELLSERVRLGTALLIISHDLAVVSQLADQIIVLREGVAVEEGPTEQVLTRPGHLYTKRLLEAVPSQASRGRRLSNVEVDAAAAARLAGSAPRTAPGHTASGGGGEVPVLAAQGIGKTFPMPGGGRRRAVVDVSLEVFPGDRVGVVGESGSGKSTLARLLLGLETPDSGRSLVHGQPWNAGDKAERVRRRHSVQFISQDPIGSFDPRYTVRQVIAEPLRGRPLDGARGANRPGGEAGERAAELAALVGLEPELLSRSPKTLSGGQAQRVAIARALALRPAVVVCDEPVSALDVSIQAQILDLLDELNRATGTALVFISHDLGVVHHLVDRVLVMTNGHVVESGHVEDVFTHPLHPYTKSLIAAIPRLPGAAFQAPDTIAK